MWRVTGFAQIFCFIEQISCHLSMKSLSARGGKKCVPPACSVCQREKHSKAVLQNQFQNKVLRGIEQAWQCVSIAAGFKGTAFSAGGKKEWYWPAPQSSPPATGFASRDASTDKEKKERKSGVRLEVWAADAANYCAFAPKQIIARTKKSGGIFSKGRAKQATCAQMHISACQLTWPSFL